MKTVNYSITIVGAGFCGTAVAMQCARLMPAASIALIERNEIHGPGLAYGTSDPDHLLNVRAETMGAFPDDVRGFYTWLEKQGTHYTAHDYVPRQLFGNFLKEKLQEARTSCPGLDLLHHRIVSIRQTGAKFELTADDGTTIASDKVVLALGNFPPAALDNAPEQNPYSPDIWKTLADNGDILIVGTGLTSLDLVVTLARTKKAGTIHLLSRHGLLPRMHADLASYTLHMQEPPSTALKLFMTVRKEVNLAAQQGLPWQSVVDALRPISQQLWQALAHPEKQRFLRHIRSYWDAHRHRCAPEIMKPYRMLEQQGRIKLHHGHIISQTYDAGGWHIEYLPRGKNSTEIINVQHIIRATGPQNDFRKLADPLVQDLLKNGLITSDPLHLGISTDQDYTAIGKSGRTEGLYALGSVLRGRLYETVAVSELRSQALDIAQSITATIS